MATGGRYEVGHSVDGDVDEGYLTVFNVTLEDSDRYICSIDIRTLGKSHAHFINLTVTGNPCCAFVVIQLFSLEVVVGGGGGFKRKINSSSSNVSCRSNNAWCNG